MSEFTASQRDKLVVDLKLLVADAEELLKLTASEVSDSATALRGRLQERLTQSRLKLMDLQAAATDRAKAASHAADEYVHVHPWESVAIGAGVGMLVGLLITRR